MGRAADPGTRTAAFDQLDPRQTAAETLTDPAIDAPVIRNEDGTLLAAVPQRLPATAPLAELILDRPVWVRTADGTLYLAPKDACWACPGGTAAAAPAPWRYSPAVCLRTSTPPQPTTAPRRTRACTTSCNSPGQPDPSLRVHMQAARDNRPWPRQ
jgi:hypothetical protein